MRWALVSRGAYTFSQKHRRYQVNAPAALIFIVKYEIPKSQICTELVVYDTPWVWRERTRLHREYMFILLQSYHYILKSCIFHIYHTHFLCHQWGILIFHWLHILLKDPMNGGIVSSSSFSFYTRLSLLVHLCVWFI